MQRNLLLATASVFAISICCGAGANAQTTVAVRGRRRCGDCPGYCITTSWPGFDAPTPVTSPHSDELLATSPSDPVDALRDSPPSLASHYLPESAPRARKAIPVPISNLRRLGANNTLVLLDGNRFVPTTTSGTVDTALFPELLINRVDVVTGGASADYGSDAVAGVVNFISIPNQRVQGRHPGRRFNLRRFPRVQRRTRLWNVLWRRPRPSAVAR